MKKSLHATTNLLVDLTDVLVQTAQALGLFKAVSMPLAVCRQGARCQLPTSTGAPTM